MDRNNFRMTKKGLIFLSLVLSLVIFSGNIFAAQISETAARQVALNLMTNHISVHGDWNGEASPQVLSIETVNYNGEPVAYLVTVYPTGHLLMAYYDDFSPVLFYSPSSTLDPSKANDPNAIESWLIPEIYQTIQIINGRAPIVEKETQRVFYLRTSDKKSTKEWSKIADAWQMLNVPPDSFSGVNRSSVNQHGEAVSPRALASTVGPLLTTKWNQTYPYSYYTPAASGCNHTYTGCVATAMAQMMKYWNWPDTGASSNSYTWNGTTLSSDFSSHTYNWTSMPDSVSSSSTTTQIDAVARLISDAGISVKMAYGCGGSSAVPTTSSFVNYFKYKPTARVEDRSRYSSSSDWMALIKNELTAPSKPRVMTLAIKGTGYALGNDHDVVIDGYQTGTSGTDQVHINYGWGGFDDGYYDITNNWTASQPW
ncbi:MAG: C10 family peptidase, partial [Nitrospirae bacterium]|nr:C10 family peptidase [Nitrospirota bacterium]